MGGNMSKVSANEEAATEDPTLLVKSESETALPETQEEAFWRTGHGPPPLWVWVAVFVVVGGLLSYFGREPGTLPHNVVSEIWLTVLAISGFIFCYVVLDTIGSGRSKYTPDGKSVGPPPNELTYDEQPLRQPEAVYLAGRAQANQVEQMPGFITVAFMFSILVSGEVGGIFSLLWVILRQIYSHKMRASVGIPMSAKGVQPFTGPCYMIVGSMATATFIHMARYACTDWKTWSAHWG